MARETETIRLCVLVSPVTFRHPAVIVKNALTIDQMSGGRFDLGIGTGWMNEEHEAFGFDLWPMAERFGRFDDALHYVKAAFGPQPARYDGTYYQLTADVKPGPTGPLPIIVGGTGKKRTPTLAGRYADEYNQSPAPVAVLAENIKTMREAAEAAGRDPADIVTSIMGSVLVGIRRGLLPRSSGRRRPVAQCRAEGPRGSVHQGRHAGGGRRQGARASGRLGRGRRRPVLRPPDGAGRPRSARREAHGPGRMKYGIDIPNFGYWADPRHVAEFAREIEDAGWDGLSIWDHLLLWHGNEVGDPWIALAAAAAATERISLMMMVTPLPRRRPWKVAREAVSLDQLSNGRFILGVGIGYPPDEEFGTFGEPTDDRLRADMLDERPRHHHRTVERRTVQLRG